jgi:uncharacterized damage-inducible protein DinB
MPFQNRPMAGSSHCLSSQPQHKKTTRAAIPDCQNRAIREPSGNAPGWKFFRPSQTVCVRETVESSDQLFWQKQFFLTEVNYMAAQPQAFPGESRNISQSILPEFDHEMANTRKSLERVPDGKLSFKPHPKSMTLGGLATHLATINQWTEAILSTDSFDVSTAPPNPEFNSTTEALAAFDTNTAAARKAIAGATDGQLMKPWSLLSKGQTIFTLPKVAVLRSFILNHAIHHRGQLGVYLRLNDVPVPSIYGPSADEGNM